MQELGIPDATPLTYDTLPSKWQIPLSSVSILCNRNKPIICGRGGFGIVYRALVAREEAAIKIVKGGGAEENARLLHEIQILEICRSSHVVQFLGFSVSPNHLLLCMEYMAGGDLYHSIRESDEFQWHNR
jgi:serine/threonine protein kinase